MFKPSKLWMVCEKVYLGYKYRTTRVNWISTSKSHDPEACQNVTKVDESRNQFAWIVQYEKINNYEEKSNNSESKGL